MSYRPLIKFDDSRIKDNPDKQLLSRITEYFKAFVDGDAKGLGDLEADEYTITDIPLAYVRSPKRAWFEYNSAFTGLTEDTQVIAISLHGSSAPGSFAIMENVIWFRLKEDPPEPAKVNLPPGIKKGDKAGMIMLSAIWWNEEGKVTKELEYGRLTWENFDISAFEN